jgi:hypothetical protein
MSVRQTAIGGALALLLLGTGCQQKSVALEIEPDKLVFNHRGAQQMAQVHGVTAKGDHVDVSKLVTWSVKPQGVASVSENGSVSPGLSGKATLIAEVGELSASIPIEVSFVEKLDISPNPVVLQEGGPPVLLTVVPRGAKGEALEGRRPMVNLQGPAIVRMEEDKLIPVRPGMTQLEIRVDEMSQRIDVRVEPKT